MRDVRDLARAVVRRVERRVPRRFVNRPRRLGSFRRPAAREKLLILAWFDPRGLRTITDNIRLLGWYSRYRWDVLNLHGSVGPGGLEIPPWVRLSDYDGVFVHCTVSYSASTLASLDARRGETLDRYEGLKILMKQDEHYRTAHVVDWAARAKIDLILTCVPESQIPLVYPPEKLPGVQLFSALTGYVTDELRALRTPDTASRPIDIGYRGSLQPLNFGRLCWEKRLIGDVFQRICQERGLSCDISSRWEDRFMGSAWFDFLGRLKGTLGVESGASVFDFDGSIEAATKQYMTEHPGASFEELERDVLAPHEGKIDYAQVSPRHFEAAAARTAQILYEGRYSGIFVPWRHYYPLARDLSNLDEVLARFLDPAERRRVVDAAYEEIVRDPRLHHSHYVARLDEVLDGLFARRR